MVLVGDAYNDPNNFNMDDFLTQPMNDNALLSGNYTNPTNNNAINNRLTSNNPSQVGQNMQVNCGFDEQQAAQALRSMRTSARQVDGTAVLCLEHALIKVNAQQKDIAEFKRSTEQDIRSLEQKIMNDFRRSTEQEIKALEQKYQKDLEARFENMKTNLCASADSARRNIVKVLRKGERASELLAVVLDVLQDLFPEETHQYGIGKGY